MQTVTNWPDFDPYSTIKTSPSCGPIGTSGDADRPFPFLAPPRMPGELGWLGAYRVLSLIGSGGMGMVFEAEDTRLKRRVALKVIRPEIAARESNRRRFLREAQAVAAIQHDHVVAIYEVGEERGVPFLAMPFLSGESLDSRLRRDGKLPIGEALRIGGEAADGLAAAHARSLVHRDIKPGNIWLEGERVRPRAKILDFGLARALEPELSLTQTGAVLGTPPYIAPEQLLDPRRADARSDVWSLAATLYHVVTGKAPRAIDLGAVDEILRPLLAKALQDDPVQRYATAEEFSLTLQAVATRLETAELPDSAADPAEYLREKARIESLLDQSRYAEAIFRLELLAARDTAQQRNRTTWAAETLEAARIERNRLRTRRPAAFASLK